MVLYVLLHVIIAHAEEPTEPLPGASAAATETTMEDMPTPAHVFHDVHNNFASIEPTNITIPPEWIARMAIYEIRINQILYRDGIIRPLLQQPEFQIFQSLYDEMVEFLELALAQRSLIAEADITNLIDSAISLQEFILKANMQSESANEFLNELMQEVLQVAKLCLALALIFFSIWLAIQIWRLIWYHFIQVWI
jgi:hypothetical protein